MGLDIPEEQCLECSAVVISASRHTNLENSKFEGRKKRAVEHPAQHPAALLLTVPVIETNMVGAVKGGDTTPFYFL